MMGAALYRARSELRRRSRATVALAVVVGLAGAVVLTVVAGARRSATAYERFREASRSSDVRLVVSDTDPARLEEVERLPQVEAVSRISIPLVGPEGTDVTPGLDFIAAASPDESFGTVLDRLRVVEGRAPDRERADELAVTEAVAADLELSVGDEVMLQSFTPEQFEALEGEDPGQYTPPAGPKVRVRVVGVVRSPLDFVGQATDSVGAHLTPAFLRTYGDSIATYRGTNRVRLRAGEADLRAFDEAVRRIYAGDPELEVVPAAVEGAKVEDAVEVVVVGLLLFGAAAGLAGAVAAGQAIGRHLSLSSSDEPVLAGLGMTASERVAASALSLLPAAVGGALLAGLGATLASPLMPVGVARRTEPDPGFSFDVLTIGLGMVGVVAVTTVLAGAAAWRVGRISSPRQVVAELPRSRTSSVARLLTAAGLSPAATTGARMAFEGGRGRAAVPVRSGLGGVVFGVAGLVAAVIFGASLATLVDTPSRYGWNWAVSVPGDYEDALLETHAEALAADPTVADLASVRTSRVEMGGTEVLAHGIGLLKGSLGPTVTEGRPARSADEVVLGDDTISRLGLGIGDPVEAKGTDGPVQLRLVGRGPIPFLDTDTVADGAMMTREGVERLATAYWYSDLILDWAPGTDEGAARRRLQEEVGPVLVNRPPADVINLDRVEALPRVLAAFLALLAVLAVTHTLVTTVRARRRDLAVLKVLGFRRRQVSATVAWQSTLLVLAGLSVGLPVGIAGGAWAWSLVARGVGVVDRAAVPVAALAVVGIGALLLANAAAVLPARRAARTQPALALRTE